MSCNYIYIYKGDDTDWNNEQLITVNVTTDSPTVDLSEMTATFILGSYKKENISLETGSFQIDLGSAVTGAFPYGAVMGVIKILDSQNRVRTVANKIPFYVTNEVITLQNQDLVIDVPQVSINLTVGGTVNYNHLSNKPSINGVTIEGEHNSDYYNLATKTALDAHIEDVNNPHEVTKEQVGLGNVDNTSDLNKPISTAVQNALNTKQDIIVDLEDIRSGAALGATAVQPATMQAALATKQDNLSASQLDAVNSGIDSAKVAQISTNKADISTINGKIPSQASSTNQLADKNFVNSSIATNTANFIGTFDSVAELEAYSGPVTNNDYAFVSTTDQAGNTLYDRYKYNGTAWVFEYELNNSSFTAAQWAALNSGATTTNIGQIATNTSDISTLQTSKQDVISDLATIRSGAALGATALQPATAASTYVPLTQKGAANGVATLDANTLIPTAQLPTIDGGNANA